MGSHVSPAYTGVKIKGADRLTHIDKFAVEEARAPKVAEA